MNDIVLFIGLTAALLSLLAVVFLVIGPPVARVSFERRSAPGAVKTSTMSALTDRTLSVIERGIRRRGRAPFNAEELEQADVRMKPTVFLFMVVTVAAALGVAGLVAARPSAWMIPLAAGLALLAPLGAKFILRVRTARRRSRFAEQLDETLGLLAGGLRAGHSLLRAIDAAAQEVESPTADEFARIVNETRIGRDLSDALDNTAIRMRSDDFQWVAQAIAINREVGGNLSGVLDQVGHTIRERNEIRRQVKTLAAEGKMSAWVLILLPVGVFAFLLLTQPTYFSGFLDNILGVMALIVAGVLLIVGSLWMMAVVKVKF
ncbi:MAG: type II secretion system F family protein [Rhodoglobus sp.]